MSLTRLKIATLVLLVVGLLAAGALFSRPAVEAAPNGQARQETPKARAQPPEQEKKDKQKPAVVEGVQPQPGGLKRTTTQPCTVKAFHRAELVSPVAGYLQVMKVDIGEHVKKGDILAELDVPLLAVEAKQAELGVRQARSHVREAQARIAAAKAEVVLAKGIIGQREAEVKGAQASAKYRDLQYARLKGLADVGSVDQKLLEEAMEHLEAARTKANAAKAAVENAKAEVAVKLGKLDQATAALESARFQIESAELALDLVRARQNQTRIRAPFDGVVTARHYHAGDYVRAGGELSLLTVDGMGRMRAIVAIPGLEAPLVEPGLPVELKFEGLPRLHIPAKIARVSGALDYKTRTMRVEIDVPNPKGQLLPGMYGEATIQLPKRANALYVPRSALVPEEIYPGGAISKGVVYVVRGKVAHATHVACGAAREGEIEIVSGLRPTDLVVLNPAAAWGQTVPVTIKQGRGEK